MNDLNMLLSCFREKMPVCEAENKARPEAGALFALVTDYLKYFIEWTNT